MMNAPMMMGMLPQMMMCHPGAGGKTKVSAYEKIEGFRPGIEAKVTTGGSQSTHCPRSASGRRSGPSRQLDVTVIGELSQESLAIVVWELTQIKPSMHVQEFRAASYVDLYSRCKASHERLLQSGRIDASYHREVADSPNMKMDTTYKANTHTPDNKPQTTKR